MAKRTQLIERHGVGANVLNPQAKRPGFDPKKETKWLRTGCHPTRDAAQAYVEKHFPKGSRVHYFGVRLPKYFFDEATEVLLARQLARIFDPDAEKRALLFVNSGSGRGLAGVVT